jgi:bifunctional non-homologous end joining protein LigD
MDWIMPMEPISSMTIPVGEEWVYQIKWDGIRGLVYCQKNGDEKQIRIFTKKRRDRTVFYPELHCLTDLITVDSAVFDGEIVVLELDGRPSFQLSLIRERVGDPGRLAYYTSRYPVIYVIFDILYYQDRLLTGLPLHQRYEVLSHSLRPGPNTIITENYTEGPELFDLMKKRGWEGMVSNKRESLYLPAKNHREWFKHKGLKKILAVVCGIEWKDASFPRSLILGIYQQNNWIFIGNASLGLTQDDWYRLTGYASAFKMESSPFQDIRRWKGKQVTWLKPLLICWVRFLEWTNDGALRHPVILGFSEGSAAQANGKEWFIDE